MKVVVAVVVVVVVVVVFTGMLCSWYPPPGNQLQLPLPGRAAEPKAAPSPVKTRTPGGGREWI